MRNGFGKFPGKLASASSCSNWNSLFLVFACDASCCFFLRLVATACLASFAEFFTFSPRKELSAATWELRRGSTSVELSSRSFGSIIVLICDEVKRCVMYDHGRLGLEFY